MSDDFDNLDFDNSLLEAAAQFETSYYRSQACTACMIAALPATSISQVRQLKACQVISFCL
jgi:hypothetical protein